MSPIVIWAAQVVMAFSTGLAVASLWHDVRKLPAYWRRLRRDREELQRMIDE